MQIHNNLFETLIKIPHLTLNISFDLEAMVDELKHIDEFVPYNSKNAISHDKYKESFFGRALYNRTGDSRDGMTEEYSDTNFIPTELAPKMPTIINAARMLGGTETRLRIMMIKSGKSLDWHRHFKQPKHLFTIHLPLIMPPDFKFIVVARDNFKANLANNRFVFPAKYPVGMPTIFNSYHLHNVFNEDESDRVSVMMYCNINTPLLDSLVREAVEAYDGPLVPTIYPPPK